jgi:hypothetical protein
LILFGFEKVQSGGFAREESQAGFTTVRPVQE